MMLLALVVTAAFALSPRGDSVRAAIKPASARPDTTLLTTPAPPIAMPTPSAPVVVLPIRPITTIATPGANPAVPSAASGHSTEVVQQASPAVPSRSIVANAPARNVATLSAPAAVATRAVSAPALDPAPAADSAAIKPPAVAPADAVARTSAEPRAVVTSTRIDPRTVVSVRSSERIEPLYAVPIPAAGLRLGPPGTADSVVVYKRERTLVLFNRGIPIRSYFVALGSKPVGDKERAGDQKTPEGVFYVNAHNPASKFHLALRLSYPDDAHRARAAALGADPGGDIMIHGLPKEYSEAGKNHLQNDWTNGCVALSNQEIEELWHAVPDGTPVHIKP
jgi:lipoprotein-anchoring transpeptidase ErfK/SrfK